jgi:hypothetical protein
VPELRSGVEHEEAEAGLREVPSDGQTGLPGTDHEHVESAVVGRIDEVAGVHRASRCCVGRTVRR